MVNLYDGQTQLKVGKGSQGEATLNRLYDKTQIYARTRLQAWGRFVATRQITVLLLCCVFLCALTYPVLSLYAWSAPSTTSDFFSFLRASPTWEIIGTDASITRTRDLRLPWQDLEAVVINAEEVCWQRIPKFREITVQQILLGFSNEGATASEHGVLDRRVLHSVHKLEQRLQEALSTRDNSIDGPITCASIVGDDDGGLLQQQGKTCFILSPMSFWNHDANEMLSDVSLIARVNDPGFDYYGLPLRPENLFVGRVHSGATLRKADFAVLTLILEGSPKPAQVTAFINELSDGLDLVPWSESKSQTKMVMKHRSDVRIRSKLWEDLFFYIGYVVVGIYIYLTLRRLDKVHSRPGLVLTGLVQMLASGMMSLSLCALAGYKINLVPWKLIPFLIVVLGVDNMFVLTTAVSNTSINLSVKERVAEGLGQSGISIFINLIAELCALWGLYLAVPTMVIREMVVFGAVALVMDYIMEMTYFVTVLSIDMQRLEMADFISQGSKAPFTPATSMQRTTSTLPRVAESILQSIRQRTARTYTAVVLVGSNWLFYSLYGPDYFVPTFCSNLEFPEPPQLKITQFPTPSEAFWRLLGARLSEAVHVHIPTPIVYLFNTNQIVAGAAKSVFTSSSLFAVLKFVVIPISLTTLGLYLLLIQLLKGSELLAAHEAQSKTLPDEESTEVAQVSVKCVQHDSSHSSDIEIIGRNEKSTALVSWAPLDNALLVTIFSDLPGKNLQRKILLKRTLFTSEGIISLVISDNSSHVAAATNQSRILVWSLAGDAEELQYSHDVSTFNSRIIQVKPFQSIYTSATSPPRAGSSQNAITHPEISFHVLLADGTLLKAGPSLDLVVPGDQDVTKAALHEISKGQIILAHYAASATVIVWAIHDDEVSIKIAQLEAETRDSHVTAQAAILAEDNIILAMGYWNGTVDVFNVSLKRAIQSAGLLKRPVRRIHLIDMLACPCNSRSSSSGISLALLASDNRTLAIHRLSSGFDGQHGTPSLTPSNSATGLSYTAHPNRRVSSPRSAADETTGNGMSLSYPLSPHAFRRLSQVSERRKAEDNQRIDNPFDLINGSVPESQVMVFDHSREVSEAKDESESTTWLLQHLGDLKLDEKGLWDAASSRIIGFRRNKDGKGLGPLRKWELWTIQISQPMMKASEKAFAQEMETFSVSSILTTVPESTRPAPNKDNFPPFQLPFDRIRCLSVSKNARCTVALGNTVLALDILQTTNRKPRRPSLHFQR